MPGLDLAAHPVPAEAGDDATRLALDGNLTIADAGNVRERLLDWLQAPGGNRRLDLAQVESIDTAGVQLLLAGRRLLAERGADLHIDPASPAVRAVLTTCGLADWLLAPSIADLQASPI